MKGSAPEDELDHQQPFGIDSRNFVGLTVGVVEVGAPVGVVVGVVEVGVPVGVVVGVAVDGARVKAMQVKRNKLILGIKW